MLQKCFSIYDAKTAYFQPPFFSPTVPSGCRMFQTLVNDGSSMVAKYPEDFQLMLIGTFDDTTGVFSGQVPECVCTGPQMQDTKPY